MCGVYGDRRPPTMVEVGNASNGDTNALEEGESLNMMVQVS